MTFGSNAFSVHLLFHFIDFWVIQHITYVYYRYVVSATAARLFFVTQKKRLFIAGLDMPQNCVMPKFFVSNISIFISISWVQQRLNLHVAIALTQNTNRWLFNKLCKFELHCKNFIETNVCKSLLLIAFAQQLYIQLNCVKRDMEHCLLITFSLDIHATQREFYLHDNDKISCVLGLKCND